jgi:hypothetical protein
MNRAQAEAIIAETLSRVKNLESEIEGLTGKEARTARFRVIAEMKRMRSAFSRILIDDERILAGKEALTPSNRDPNIPSQKVDEYDHLFAQKATMPDGKLAYVASTAVIDVSDENDIEMEKLKNDIIAKAEGRTRGRIHPRRVSKRNYLLS